ncbi:hypothetical protein PSAR109036_10195 [Psychrobacter arenosus]|uniref:hypothetical protein n=1 Tax=Psychrobacter arenosus TaxID=256326 RepID=UPI001D109A1C|nr:hypothetical protein [Psychrobacter arenosus]
MKDASTTPPTNPVKADAKRQGKVSKPIAPIQKRLRAVWATWLGYRLIALPILIALLSPQHPDMLGGIAWQALWLIPAFIMTPAIFKGTSPYVLLIGSMLTLVYLGASGVVIFARAYAVDLSVLWIYGIDFVLLFLINTWLFILTKRLPSMNKAGE